MRDTISSLTNVTPSALRFSLSKGANKSSSSEVDRLQVRHSEEMGVRNTQNFITKGMLLIRQGVYVLVAMDAIKAVQFFPDAYVTQMSISHNVSETLCD